MSHFKAMMTGLAALGLTACGGSDAPVEAGEDVAAAAQGEPSGRCPAADTVWAADWEECVLQSRFVEGTVPSGRWEGNRSVPALTLAPHAPLLDAMGDREDRLLAGSASQRQSLELFEDSRGPGVLFSGPVIVGTDHFIQINAVNDQMNTGLQVMIYDIAPEAEGPSTLGVIEAVKQAYTDAFGAPLGREALEARIGADADLAAVADMADVSPRRVEDGKQFVWSGRDGFMVMTLQTDYGDDLARVIGVFPTPE